MIVPFLSLRDISAKYKSELHEAVLRVVDSGERSFVSVVPTDLTPLSLFSVPIWNLES